MQRYLQSQCGGTLLGFVLGLVVGLGVALAVAVYVTKAPISFVNKVSAPSAEPDVVEAEKNRTWNPNAPLHGKKPQRSASGSVTVSNDPDDSAVESAGSVSAPAISQRTVGKASMAVQQPSADPLGDFAQNQTTRTAQTSPVQQPKQASASNPASFPTFYVQLGAYRTAEEAENQRAKYSLDGLETQISQRIQSGKTVYRVRMGPYEGREQAERVKADLDARGLDTALVRVQHQ